MYIRGRILVEDRIRYRKTFLIFSQEDTGFGTGQEPSGHIKIEVMDNRGKLLAQVANLKEDYRFDYKLYILKCAESQVSYVCAGSIPLQKGRGELKWEFDPDNVGTTGISIDAYDTAAVLVEYKDKTGQDIVCPLAAYKDKKVPWRDKVKGLLYPVQPEPVNMEEYMPKVENIFSGIGNSIGSSSENSNENISENSIENISMEEPDNTGQAEPAEEPAAEEGNQEACEEEELQVIVPQGNVEGEMDGDDVNAALENTEPDTTVDQLADLLPGEDDNIIPDNNGENANDSISGENSGCMYGSQSACNTQPAEIEGKKYNPCMYCYANMMKRGAVKEAPKADNSNSVSMERLKEGLDKFFEICHPFRSRRRDYEWWRVNSPVHLNNILYQCNIKTPVLFNPSVMMAHFKYRHLIIGIYVGRTGRREYVVCGVPGVYGVDERPFGNMCIWAQAEGNRPRYGAFGYWIVYMDPKTGKLLNMN